MGKTKTLQAKRFHLVWYVRNHDLFRIELALQNLPSKSFIHLKTIEAMECLIEMWPEYKQKKWKAIAQFLLNDFPCFETFPESNRLFHLRLALTWFGSNETLPVQTFNQWVHQVHEYQDQEALNFLAKMPIGNKEKVQCCLHLFGPLPSPTFVVLKSHFAAWVKGKPVSSLILASQRLGVRFTPALFHILIKDNRRAVYPAFNDSFIEFSPLWLEMTERKMNDKQRESIEILLKDMATQMIYQEEKETVSRFTRQVSVDTCLLNDMETDRKQSWTFLHQLRLHIQFLYHVPLDYGVVFDIPAEIQGRYGTYASSTFETERRIAYVLTGRPWIDYFHVMKKEDSQAHQKLKPIENTIVYQKGIQVYQDVFKQLVDQLLFLTRDVSIVVVSYVLPSVQFQFGPKAQREELVAAWSALGEPFPSSFLFLPPVSLSETTDDTTTNPYCVPSGQDEKDAGATFIFRRRLPSSDEWVSRRIN